jgi:hypothetical protein
MVASIEYMSAMNCICNSLFDRSIKSKDVKLRHISLMIYNYIVNMIKEHNIDYKYTDGVTQMIDMVPVYDYIYQNQIELYDLDSIEVDDMDVNKKADVERFILSHINYIFNK